MDITLINHIKKIAIIALASDDELIETIVLKGGNAIDLISNGKFKSTSRTSYDLDFSVEDAFFEDEQMISGRIQATLKKTFPEFGYIVLDYTFGPRPKTSNPATADFWGGYLCTFKLIAKEQYDKFHDDKAAQTRNSIPLKRNLSPKFELEFSKYEYVKGKEEITVDGFSIYVYTPEMIVFEKLRALCQQLPAYAEVIPSHSPRARARDFYDIWMIMQTHNIDPERQESKEMMANIFSAKKVPLALISDIKDHKYIHEDNWKEVLETLPKDEPIQPFDFYFDFVCRTFCSLTFP